MLARSSLLAGSSNLIELGLSLLTAGLTIRYLGLEDAGFFLFFESLLRVNGGLFNLGFQGAVACHAGRAIADKNPVTAREYLETGLTLDALIALIPCLLLLSFSGTIVSWSGYSGASSTAATFIILSVAALVLQKINASLQNGLLIHHAYGAHTAFKIASGTLTQLARLAVLVTIPSLVALGWTLLACSALTVSALLILFVRHNHWFPRPRIVRKHIHALWSFTKWEYLWSLCSMLTSDLDRILITQYFGLQTLPLYSMSKRVLLLGHRFIAGFTDYLFPLLSGQTKQDRKQLIQNLNTKLPWCLFGLGCLVYGSAVICGPFLLNLLVGNHFGSDARTLIFGFTCVGLIYLYNVLPFQIARSTGRTKLNTLISIPGSILVFSSIWIACQSGQLFLAVISPVIVLPLTVLHAHLITEVHSWASSLKQLFQPSLGFVSLFALCSIAALKPTTQLSDFIQIAFLQSLLIVGVGLVSWINYQRNPPIRALLDRIISTAKSRVTILNKSAASKI